MAKATVLIVEDEVIVAKDIQAMVQTRGYEAPAIAYSGEEAIKKAEEIKPDLVLMDIVLRGEMDGITASEQIRNRLDVPIVYITAYAEDKTIARAKVTEPFGYLLKPFEERELHTAIEIALYKHKLEKALRESEERFYTFFDGLPVGVIMSDSEGSIMAANKAISRLIGYPQEKLIGRHFAEITHSEDWDNCKDLYNSLINGERDRYLNDRRFMRKDREIIWSREHASAIKDEKGNFKYATLIIEDLTELKQVEETLLRKKTELKSALTECQRIEEALALTEQKYKEIAEFLPDLIYRMISFEA